MIEKEVQVAASNFQTRHRSLVDLNPHLRLDLCWPSVGVVDAILAPLRGRDRLNEQQATDTFEAACYLGTIVYNAWSGLPGTKSVELSLSGDKTDVIVAVEGGPFLEPTLRHSFALNQSVRKLLKEDSDVVEPFLNVKRLLAPQQDLLTQFMSGVVFGLAPDGKGPWREKTPAQAQSQIKHVISRLAESCATSYRTSFPNEPLGAAPGLYESGLLFPPTGIGEPFPVINATSGTIAYLLSRKFQPETWVPLFENLAHLPGETLNAAGFALCVSLLADIPAPIWLRLQGQSRGIQGAYLRPAVINARSEQALPLIDVILSLSQQKETDAQTLLARETEANITPLWRMSESLVADSRLLEFVESIVCFNTAHALDVGYKLYRSGSFPEDAVPQLIFLALATNQTDQADQLLTEVRQVYVDPSRSLRLGLLELRGLRALQEQDFQLAYASYSELFNELKNRPDPAEAYLLARAGGTLATLERSSGEHAQARDINDTVLKEAPWSLDAHIFEWQLAIDASDNHRANNQQQLLINEAWHDHRVLKLLKDSI